MSPVLIIPRQVPISAANQKIANGDDARSWLGSVAYQDALPGAKG